VKSQIILPLALTASLTLMAACQKPASTADTTSTTASTDSTTGGTAGATGAAGAAQDAAANASSVTSAGGAVSPPASNGAINTDTNKSSTDVAAASNSFTESQAKGHIEKAGYTDVTGLAKGADGLWTATAKKGGKTMTVALDFKGAVTAK
jgi:hypothetical protein